MTQSQFSNASNRWRMKGSSGGRNGEAGSRRGVGDEEWERDKLEQH